MYHEKVRNLLTKIGVNTQQIDNETDLINNSILDSLGLIALISIMEEDLKISLNSVDYDVNNFRTIDKLSEIIRKYLQ